ncbi:MAG TPA: flagellar biosynthetic protein FliR [Vicinamibacterales bacterium]|nr:flagellar biosynthetic protein FliR [Vicinamibacterales bacterium]
MDPSFALRLGLLLVRPAALLAIAPPFGGSYTPAWVKIGMSVVLALFVAPTVSVPEVTGGAMLVVVVARELMIGIALAMAVRVMLAGVELAGQLAGFQLGFAYAAAVDPQTGARNNLIATLYANLALFTFLAINAHHLLLRAFTQSYASVPIGLGGVDAGLGALVARTLGAIFLIGVQLAAPVVIVLLIVELGLGLITRAAPALNMMIIGFPVRLLAGLIVLGATVSIVPALTHGAVPTLLDLAARLARAFR